MKLETIAEHTLAMDILPERAQILDIGARGLLFANELISRGHEVWTIDADDLEGMTHPNLAISDYDGYCYLRRTNDPQATMINERIPEENHDSVLVMTLKSYSKMVNVDFWDAIKIDCEGAEYEIIMSMDAPMATQLSIEFHLHTGIYGQKEVHQMEKKLLSLGYFAVSHLKYPAHGCSANYWDSLWVYEE
jgi:hypothetical protein